MSEYRRACVPSGTFFLTLVTYNRVPLLADSQNISRLRCALAMVRREKPFEVVAAIILPDHIHFMWTLPPADPDFSKRIGRLKVLFTHSLRGRRRLPENVPRSRIIHRESDVWQRRFWEHTIRDEQDFKRHLDYIHYNPVKHGLTSCPHLWVYSSFRRWVHHGAYAEDWCCTCDGRQARALDFTDIARTVGE